MIRTLRPSTGHIDSLVHLFIHLLCCIAHINMDENTYNQVIFAINEVQNSKTDGEVRLQATQVLVTNTDLTIK